VEGNDSFTAEYRNMSDTQHTTQASTPGLDRRALWLSVGGGSVTGLLFSWAYIQSSLTGQPLDQGLDGFGDAVEDLIGDLVLPLLISLLARRRPFLWAVLGMAANLLWSVADRVVARNWAGLFSDLRTNALTGAVTLMLISAPISLVRYLLRLRRERTAHALLAQRQAWESGSVQDGIWPPPPNRPPL
jgi:hypothetical protein